MALPFSGEEIPSTQQVTTGPGNHVFVHNFINFAVVWEFANIGPAILPVLHAHLSNPE